MCNGLHGAIRLALLNPHVDLVTPARSRIIMPVVCIIGPAGTLSKALGTYSARIGLRFESMHSLFTPVDLLSE